MSVALPAVLDTGAAAPLRRALLDAIARGETLTLDGSAVERVGQACLQVLMAARIAAAGSGLGFRVVAPGPGLIELTALTTVDLTDAH